MKPYQRIKAHIIEQGLKQRVVASRAGYSDRQFSLMMTGKKRIDIDDYEKICTALKVPAAAFLNTAATAPPTAQ